MIPSSDTWLPVFLAKTHFQIIKSHSILWVMSGSLSYATDRGNGFRNLQHFPTISESTTHRLSAKTQTFCFLNLCSVPLQSIEIKSTGCRRISQGEDAETWTWLLRVFRGFRTVFFFISRLRKKELARCTSSNYEMDYFFLDPLNSWWEGNQIDDPIMLFYLK